MSNKKSHRLDPETRKARNARIHELKTEHGLTNKQIGQRVGLDPHSIGYIVKKINEAKQDE